MTEVLLQQLEEKMMTRLSELETLRRELDSAKRENSVLKVEREKLEDRVKGIISLLETVNAPETTTVNTGMTKPVLMQA